MLITTIDKMSSPDLKRKIISVLLVDDEVDRFKWLEEQGKKRNSLYNRNALIRELLGLENHNLTTDEERLYFLGQGERPPDFIKVDVIPPYRGKGQRRRRNDDKDE